jgi:malate dehydrogenase (oxaloacetate-decarboxylating)(NADP+)
MTGHARRSPKRIVLAEGHSGKVIRAAQSLVEDGVAHPILMGRPSTVREKAEDLGVSLEGVEILFAVDEEELRERYARDLFQRRGRKGLTLAEARANMYKPIYFALSMLRSGDADGVVAGLESNYPEILRPALEVVGVAKGVDHVAGLYMLAFPNRDLLFFADTTVNIDPDAKTLADIALLSARFVRDLGITPRIAMVSFSNFGSSRHPEALKVAEAVQLVRERDHEIIIDGEMQADTAVDLSKLREVYAFSNLNETANVLIFSNLTAANASYKLLDRLGGAEVIGPVLLGMERPVHILQRGSSFQDIVNLVTVATVDAQGRVSRD